jgi:divalent metal cation (Fe/Co/Zn/Cd) transporter
VWRSKTGINPIAASTARSGALKSGVRLEVLTVAWMAIEAVVAIGAGIFARSLLLTAFGLDSVIELLSGALLAWRLQYELSGRPAARVESAERIATKISAVLLVLLCAYLVFVGLAGVISQIKPEGSAIGVGVALAALIVMPLLGLAKRRANRVIESAALRADIVETATCAYMAAATLVGTAANLWLGWWWAEYAAALALLYFVVREAREAVQSARGRDSDDD